jgi:hypothetical protein
MANQREDLVYDNRLVVLNTKLGYLDEKNWDAHQKKLPDLKNQAEEWVMFTEESIDGSGEPTFAAIEQK